MEDGDEAAGCLIRKDAASDFAPLPGQAAVSLAAPVAAWKTARKRHAALVPAALASPDPPGEISRPSPSSRGFTADDAVESLLPKMKRMRLRPSLGQLRLQREADDCTVTLPPQVRMCIEPDHLRASVIIGETSFDSDDVAIQVELSFPAQYPHRPPKVVQIAPEGRLPAWQYDGNFVILARLREDSWSSVMGAADIVQDLVDSLSSLSPEVAPTAEVCQKLQAQDPDVRYAGRFPPLPLPEGDSAMDDDPMG